MPGRACSMAGPASGAGSTPSEASLQQSKGHEEGKLAARASHRRNGQAQASVCPQARGLEHEAFPNSQVSTLLRQRGQLVQPEHAHAQSRAKHGGQHVAPGLGRRTGRAKCGAQR